MEYFVQKWVKYADPDDANDGFDNAGVALGIAGGFNNPPASYVQSTKTLTSVGAFQLIRDGWGVDWFAGDKIYLTGGTGITPGFVTVASQPADGDNLVIEEDLGSDINASITSSTGPKATAAGINAVMQDDDICWMTHYASGVAHFPLTIAHLGGEFNNTVSGARWIFYGYLLQAGDGFRCDIDATGFPASPFTSTDGTAGLRVHNFNIANSPFYGIEIKTTNHTRQMFVNCSITNCTSGGIFCEYSGSTGLPNNPIFVHIQVKDCGGRGIYVRRATLFAYCEVSNCGGNGFHHQDGNPLYPIAVNCISVNNTGVGFYRITHAFGCTAAGNSSHGFEHVNGFGAIFCNNAITHNGGYGWSRQSVGSKPGDDVFITNGFHLNTSGDTENRQSGNFGGEDVVGGIGNILDDVLADPEYLDLPNDDVRVSQEGIFANRSIIFPYGAVPSFSPAGGASGTNPNTSKADLGAVESTANGGGEIPDDKTTVYENDVLETHIGNQAPIVQQATYYLALLTAITDKDAGDVTELNVTGYARQPITTADWNAASSGVKSNNTIIDFGITAEDWVGIVGIGLSTASLPGSGTWVVISDLQDAPITIPTGNVPLFEAGQLVLKEL